MKIIVCGGRDYSNYRKVEKVLDFYRDDHLVIGGAPGLDSLAEDWARANRVNHTIIYANWDLFKKAAGRIRNEEMLTYSPKLVISFPGGRGTAHMTSIALKAGVKVKEID